MREQEESSRDELRHARKLDRKEQKEQLDELVPRAAAGTRERQVEKKREVNDKMRAFRKKSPGAMEDVNERELMGGGDEGGIGAHRAKVKAHERKKNERELRKEEMLRVCSGGLFCSIRLFSGGLHLPICDCLSTSLCLYLSACVCLSVRRTRERFRGSGLWKSTLTATCLPLLSRRELPNERFASANTAPRKRRR